MNWNDFRDIGELLLAKHGKLNPLSVRFTDLHKWVLELENFEGKPEASNEKFSKESRWLGMTNGKMSTATTRLVLVFQLIQVQLVQIA